MDDDGRVASRPPLLQSSHHVKKRARKNVGATAVYDENARREYLTGFRKRKQERRKQAEAEQAVKLRRKRIQERAQKRLQLKIARGEVTDDAEGEMEGGRIDVPSRKEANDNRDVVLKSSFATEKEELAGSDDSAEVEEAMNGEGQNAAVEGVTTYDSLDTTTVVITSVINPLDDDGVGATRVGNGGSLMNSRSVNNKLGVTVKNLKRQAKAGKSKKRKRDGGTKKGSSSKASKGKSKRKGKGRASKR